MNYSEWQAQQKWNLLKPYKRRPILKKIGRGYQYAVIVWGKLPKQIRSDLFREFQRTLFKYEQREKAA